MENNQVKRRHQRNKEKSQIKDAEEELAAIDNRLEEENGSDVKEMKMEEEIVCNRW